MNLVSEEFNFLKPLKFSKLTRLGNEYDGGYIIPEISIVDSDGLISFGYGYDPSFEKDYIKRSEKKVFIFDHTCGYLNLFLVFIRYLKRFLLFRKKFKDTVFHYNNLKNHHDFVSLKNINFFKKKIVKNKLHNDEINLDDIISISNFKNAILKCDIEGSEYEIIQDIIKYEKLFNCIIIEFHNIDKNIEKFKYSINQLLEFYNIVHLHGNNHDPIIDKINIPSTLEITLVKKFFNKEEKYIYNFPIEYLDRPNNPNQKELEFEFQK